MDDHKRPGGCIWLSLVTAERGVDLGRMDAVINPPLMHTLHSN